MGTEDRLIIPYKGLKEGVHFFSYYIKDNFFKLINYSDINKGGLTAKIRLDKQTRQLVLEVEIYGGVNVMCDRCLDYFDLQVHFNGTLFAKFINERKDFEENIEEDYMLIPNDNYEVDISHYIYESICLSLPVQKIHPVDKDGRSQCNKKMLIKIAEYSANRQADSNIDPRWTKLKNINII